MFIAKRLHKWLLYGEITVTINTVVQFEVDFYDTTNYVVK